MRATLHDLESPLYFARLFCKLPQQDEIGRIKALLADEPTTGLERGPLRRLVAKRLRIA